MNSRRADWYLIGLAVLLILVSFYQLFLKVVNTTTGPSLATLSTILSVVKTKHADTLDWRDALKGNELVENQLIYTDNKSSADIFFHSGRSIKLGENSLIKLRSEDEGEAVDVSRGFIEAHLSELRPLTLNINGENYSLSGKADVQISLSDNKGEIGIINGEVSIERGNKVEKIDSQSAIVLDGNSISRRQIYFQIEAPLRGEVKYITSSSTPVSFSWYPKEEARIHLGRDPSLTKPRTIKMNEIGELLLEEGTYYYKILSSKGVSLTQSFRIEREIPPKIIRPKGGSDLEIMEPSLLLQWQSSGISNFLLEWNDGELKSKRVSGSSAVIEFSESGALSWRVRIDDENRPLARWSDWQELKVRRIPPPSLPQMLFPDEVEYQFYGTQEDRIEFNWQSALPVEFELQNPQGKTARSQVVGNFYEKTISHPGTYLWRVRSYDKYSRTSEWTEWKKIIVEDFSSQKDGTGIQRIQLKKPDQTVTFSWDAENEDRSVFELSKDSRFKEVVRKLEVNQDSVKVAVPGVGTYYWRSRKFLKDGSFHVSEPKKVIISPTPAPSKPEKFPDLKIPIKELPKSTSSRGRSFLRSFFSLLVSSAYANELKGQVSIELPIKEDAKGYIVKIYKDQNLTKLVHEENLTTKNFHWVGVVPGTYYWQYALTDYWDRTSPFSDPAMLVITGELMNKPERPKLLFPIRAQKVSIGDLILNWTSSGPGSRYVVEVSEDSGFTKVISRKEITKTSVNYSDLNLEPALYFWRVIGKNSAGIETLSNTGRFTIIPSRETQSQKKEIYFQKQWRNRGHIAWAISKDNYTFQDGKTGTIDGMALMGGVLAGTFFLKDWVVNGEILQQTGKVFKGEEYIFRRLQMDFIRSWSVTPNWKWGLGFSTAQVTGGGYEISAVNKVTSNSVSGINYGPILRNYFSFNANWEMQNRLSYQLGEIKSMEVDLDIIKHRSSIFLLSGLGVSMREYKVSSGKQTSLKILLGIGKEF